MKNTVEPWRICVDRIRLPILPGVCLLRRVQVDISELAEQGLVQAEAFALQQLLCKLAGAVVDQALNDAPENKKNRLNNSNKNVWLEWKNLLTAKQ